MNLRGLVTTTFHFVFTLHTKTEFTSPLISHPASLGQLAWRMCLVNLALSPSWLSKFNSSGRTWSIIWKSSRAAGDTRRWIGLRTSPPPALGSLPPQFSFGIYSYSLLTLLSHHVLSYGSRQTLLDNTIINASSVLLSLHFFTLCTYGPCCY